MKKTGIRVEGHRGAWYVIDESYYRGEKVYLLEHEKYGEDAPALIVNEKLEVIVEEVHNGFFDLDY